jgi:hypothetical protein
MAAVAPFAAAEDEGVTEHVSIELDAGFLSDYDDSKMWAHGYDAGVTGLWSSNGSTMFCARFGLSHWSYMSGPVVADLVPEGALLTAESSSGQVQKLTFTPMVRYQREGVLSKLGAFVEGGVGVAYVKTFARTEVLYEEGVQGTQKGAFEISESDVGAQVLLGAGLFHSLTSLSCIDLMSTYQALITGDTAHFFSVHVGYRLRV